MIEAIQTIPLDEILPGAAIRVTVISGVQYLSVRDLIMFVCDATVDYAGQIWRNVSFSRKSEVQDHLSSFHFPGRGQSDQPVITFPGAIKLSMFLPGKKAKKNRSLMANIIVRYFAGDRTLIEDIATNAMLDHPVAQMARDSVNEDKFLQSADPEEIRLKRKREELKLMHEEVELYSSIITHNVLDEHGKNVFKERVLNMFAKESMELQRQKRKDDIDHALALLDIENQKLTAEQESVKRCALAMLGVENERRAAERDHAEFLLEMGNREEPLEGKQTEAKEHPKETMIAEQENPKAKLGIENERRAAERDHTKRLSDQKQPIEKVKVKEQWQYASKDCPEIHNQDITSGKDYVFSLLQGKMNPEMIQHTYTSLVYRLKRYNPAIQVIKRDSRIFFKHADLPAIQRVLYKTIGM